MYENLIPPRLAALFLKQLESLPPDYLRDGNECPAADREQ